MRSRGLRFSLKFLMIVVTVASVGFWRLSVTLENWRRQGAALRELPFEVPGMSIDVVYKNHFDINAPWHGSQTAEQRRVGFWQRWLGDDALVEVASLRLDYDYGPDIAANQWAYYVEAPTAWTFERDARLRQTKILKNFTDLRALEFSGGLILLDSDLREISACESLEILHCTCQTEFSDEGLAALASLRRLRELSICCKNITDQGLKHLRRFPQLERLTLRETGVTNEGLLAFVEQSRIKELILGDNNLTHDCARRLLALGRLERLEIDGATHLPAPAE